MQPFISRFTHGLSIVVIATVFAACSPTATLLPDVTTAPAPSSAAIPSTAAVQSTVAATAPTGDAAIKASIQETLDRYAKAWNDGDAALLQTTVDPKSGPFRRLVVGRFEIRQASALQNLGGEYSYKVLDIKPRDFGFVQATIDSYGYKLTWTFREVDGRWLLSEPSQQQIGKRVKQEGEFFTFQTYPWANDVNDEIEKIMNEARAEVLEKLGRVPETKATVTILPTFGAGPAQGSGTLAFYDRNSRSGVDQIVINAPDTFSFGGYDPATGWQPELRQTLVHEYTHLVNNRSFTPISRMSDWMFEGIAEYVSESSRASEVSAAVSSDNIIPIIDPSPSNAASPQDLQHLTILTRDVSLAYGLSYSLVAYIADTYGGLDGFWKFVAAYDKRQNLEAALQEAFGVSYEQFDSDWRAWLRENY